MKNLAVNPVVDDLSKSEVLSIPYDHRMAVHSIDSAFGQNVCVQTLNVSSRPLEFAEACFYFLDSAGKSEDPLRVIDFCKYLIEQYQLSGEARFILSTMLRLSPGRVGRFLA